MSLAVIICSAADDGNDNKGNEDLKDFIVELLKRNIQNGGDY